MFIQGFSLVYVQQCKPCVTMRAYVQQLDLDLDQEESKRVMLLCVHEMWGDVAWNDCTHKRDNFDYYGLKCDTLHCYCFTWCTALISLDNPSLESLSRTLEPYSQSSDPC